MTSEQKRIINEALDHAKNEMEKAAYYLEDAGMVKESEQLMKKVYELDYWQHKKVGSI